MARARGIFAGMRKPPSYRGRELHGIFDGLDDEPDYVAGVADGLAPIPQMTALKLLGGLVLGAVGGAFLGGKLQHPVYGTVGGGAAGLVLARMLGVGDGANTEAAPVIADTPTAPAPAPEAPAPAKKATPPSKATLDPFDVIKNAPPPPKTASTPTKVTKATKVQPKPAAAPSTRTTIR